MDDNKYKYVNIDGKTETEHRSLLEKRLGRRLDDRFEVTHHKNGNKSDNRVENLEIMSRSEHAKLHARRAERVELHCKLCNKVYFMRKKKYEWKIKRGEKVLFCSKRCQGLTKQPPHRNISLEHEEIIRREFGGGLSGYAIAKKYGLNAATVYNHLRKRPVV